MLSTIKDPLRDWVGNFLLVDPLGNYSVSGFALLRRIILSLGIMQSQNLQAIA